MARRFAFEQWPDFDARGFAALRAELQSRILARCPVPLEGADRDAGAIAAAAGNAERAGVIQDVSWRRGAISSLAPSIGPGWIVTNPPYGARIGERAKLRDLYAQIGNVLRRRASGWRIAMITADRMLESQVRLPWREVARTENGGIKVRFVTAEIGSND
jgi:putative N6-adenine-specific DNA methylase